MEGFDVAQLAHVELYTPNPEGTLWFFKEVLGLEETAREGQTVYLRAYEDWYHHTLKITEAKEARLGHIAWRAASPEALARRVKALEASGLGEGWTEGDLGHGPAYRFRTPDGHRMELFFEVEYYEAPPEKRSKLKNRPSKRPLRGVPARRLDHVNCLCAEVTPNRRFFEEVLGFKLREQKVRGEGEELGAWLSVSPLVHEIGLMRDATGLRGRFHHIAFWYGYPQHLLDLADVLVEYDVQIEAGPGKHGTTQAYFMYVFEPGGTRVELFGDTGYLIFDPTWKTVVWDVTNVNDLEKSTIWFGGQLPETFYSYGRSCKHLCVRACV
jgi:catechol 2,3-dioxygenase